MSGWKCVVSIWGKYDEKSPRTFGLDADVYWYRPGSKKSYRMSTELQDLGVLHNEQQNLRILFGRRVLSLQNVKITEASIVMMMI